MADVPYCIEQGCEEIATHERLYAMAGDTPVVELVCCHHHNRLGVARRKVIDTAKAWAENVLAKRALADDDSEQGMAAWVEHAMNGAELHASLWAAVSELIQEEENRG